MSDQELRQIPIVCPGHSRPLAEVHYSPVTSEGFFLISACHDKLPMLRRGETGDWVGTFEGHKGAVWSAKLDRSATKAATGSADFSVKLWDAVKGDELHTFSHKHVVKTVEFSKDNKTLFTGGHEQLLRIFDLTKLEQSPIELSCEDHIRKIAMVSDTIIVSGEVNGMLRIWDLTTNTQQKQIHVGSSIMDLEVSRNGTILTVAAGKEVIFYNTQDFQEIARHSMPISFGEEGGASLHPTANRYIAGGSDTWVRVFDYATGNMLECHKGHHGPIRCLRYSPEGESFASGSEDGTIRIWQTDLKSAAASSVPDVQTAE